MSAIQAEFDARKEAEREKCIRKYGADALLAAGRPDLDIADYCLNELVGLIRYAQMLASRADLMDKLFEGETRRKAIQVIKEQERFSRELEATAGRLAYDLIGIRQRLKAMGLHLGFTEAGTPVEERRRAS